MSTTDLKIQKGIRQGCSNARIAAKLGRPLTPELDERIEKLRKGV
jgi:hypothetical protein